METQNNKNGTKTIAASTQYIGKTLGNFRIVEELGRGGMGLVFKAYDRALDRVVALKILPPQLQDGEFIKRFVREARTAAKLDHPNVVQIYSVGKNQDIWYIAMQYVKGKTIAEYINEGYRFSSRQALIITRAVSAALGAAHRLGIIHRDIKPSNIMIDETGKVKVMDFGLARAMVGQGKVTQTGTYLGTPEYSSPEQCESGQVDGRADIYSLGVVLYELLSGHVPHTAETPLKLFKKIIEETPIPIRELNSAIPASVADLVAKMLAKEKGKRYQNTLEIIKQIDKIIQTEKLPELAGAKLVKVVIDEKVTPVRPRFMGELRKPTQPLMVLGVVGVGLVLLGFILFVIHLTQRSPAAPDATQTAAAPVIPAEKATIIVFDFINQTNKEEAKWLEPALSDMLIARLSQQNEQIQVIPRYDLLLKMKQLGKKITLGAQGDERIILNSENETLIKSFETNLVVRGSFYVTEGKQIRIINDLYRYYGTGPKESLRHIGTLMVEGNDYNRELFSMVDQLSEKILTILSTKARDFGLLIAGLTPSQPKDEMKNLVARLLTNTLTEQPKLTETAGRDMQNKLGTAPGKISGSLDEALNPLRVQDETKKTKEGNSDQKGSPLEDSLKFTKAAPQQPPAKPGAKNIKLEESEMKENTQQLGKTGAQPLNNFQAQQYLTQEKDSKSLTQALKQQQSLAREKLGARKGDRAGRQKEELQRSNKDESGSQHELNKEPGLAAELNGQTLDQGDTVTETTTTKITLPDGEEMELDEITMNQLLQNIYQRILEKEKEAFKPAK